MSAVFDKVCPACGRPQLLWGGATCDVCDRDNNGINDRDEPVGTGLTAGTSLFPADEKGWVMMTRNIPVFVGFPGCLIPAMRPMQVIREAARNAAADIYAKLLPNLPKGVDRGEAKRACERTVMRQSGQHMAAF